MTEPPSELEPRPDAQLDEFRDLVRAAFEQAMNSGKVDWDEMTSAVLKNRLLSLTGRQFSQSRYGSPSFIHLVRRVPDLLEVIDERPPFLLKLRTPITEQTPLGPNPDTVPQPVDQELFAALNEGDWHRIRIRDDLWQAIIDYRSNHTYILDPNTGLARPKEPSDSELPEFPTASQEDLRQWRQQFVDSVTEQQKNRFNDELRSWLEGRGRQSDLPRPLRGLWAEYVKRKVVSILRDWFKAQIEFPPNDMIVRSEGQITERGAAIDEVVRTRQLRDLIIRAIRTMSYDELAQIPLPASVLVRVSGSRSQM